MRHNNGLRIYTEQCNFFFFLSVLLLPGEKVNDIIYIIDLRSLHLIDEYLFRYDNNYYLYRESYFITKYYHTRYYCNWETAYTYAVINTRVFRNE